MLAYCRGTLPSHRPRYVSTAPHHVVSHTHRRRHRITGLAAHHAAHCCSQPVMRLLSFSSRHFSRSGQICDTTRRSRRYPTRVSLLYYLLYHHPHVQNFCSITITFPFYLYQLVIVLVSSHTDSSVHNPAHARTRLVLHCGPQFLSKHTTYAVGRK